MGPGGRRTSRARPHGAAPRNVVGRYEGSWEGRAIPSFFNRLRSVLGWSPRIPAAPARTVEDPVGLCEDGEDMASLELFQ